MRCNAVEAGAVKIKYNFLSDEERASNIMDELLKLAQEFLRSNVVV